MSLISISDLSFTYEGSVEPVFDGLDVRFDSGWKLGLVGANGRGKTTLLKLLSGELRPDLGRVEGPVARLGFPVAVRDAELLGEYVAQEAAPEVERWKFLRELGLLGLDEESLWRPFSTLSGGEQTRLLLALCFAGEEGNLLLLDEPTNHLDGAAREQVAAYLERKSGFLLVSHDRALLDRVTDHTLALLPTRAEVCRGGFSTWFAENETRNDRERAEQENLKKDIRRMREAARQASNWSDAVERSKFGGDKDGSKVDRGFVGKQAATMMQRAKNLQHRREKAIREKEKLLHDVERSEALKLTPKPYWKSRLIELEGVSVSYGGQQVCRDIDLTVNRGERVCLSGPNGCGKSSLLKLILGETIAHTGRVAVGSGLEVSYVSQDTGHLAGTPLAYAQARGVEPSRMLTILRKLGFPREAFERDMDGYSAGQKKKVLLAESLCRRAHLYLWDEPLNFLDVFARQRLEELVLSAGATMLFVEHDPMFREHVATRVVEV